MLKKFYAHLFQLLTFRNTLYKVQNSLFDILMVKNLCVKSPPTLGDHHE